MRRIGDELAARTLELRQTLAHPLHGGGQITQLVLPAVGYTGSLKSPPAIRSAARSRRRILRAKREAAM